MPTCIADQLVYRDGHGRPAVWADQAVRAAMPAELREAVMTAEKTAARLMSFTRIGSPDELEQGRQKLEALLGLAHAPAGLHPPGLAGQIQGFASSLCAKLAETRRTPEG